MNTKLVLLGLMVLCRNLVFSEEEKSPLGETFDLIEKSEGQVKDGVKLTVTGIDESTIKGMSEEKIQQIRTGIEAMSKLMDGM